MCGPYARYGAIRSVRDLVSSRTISPKGCYRHQSRLSREPDRALTHPKSFVIVPRSTNCVCVTETLLASYSGRNSSCATAETAVLCDVVHWQQAATVRCLWCSRLPLTVLLHNPTRATSCDAHQVRAATRLPRRTSTRERAHTSTLAHSASKRCTRACPRRTHPRPHTRQHMWQEPQDSQGQHATHRLRPRRCRVQGRPSQQRVRRRRLRRRLPTAMAAGGLGRRRFAPTALASVRLHAQVALVRCYASRKGGKSGQAAFACHGRLPEQCRLRLCWE